MEPKRKVWRKGQKDALHVMVVSVDRALWRLVYFQRMYVFNHHPIAIGFLNKENEIGFGVEFTVTSSIDNDLFMDFLN
jgi:hypothetical protein